MSPRPADTVVVDARERVRRSLGPLPGGEADYWAELAAADWSAWAPAVGRGERRDGEDAR